MRTGGVSNLEMSITKKHVHCVQSCTQHMSLKYQSNLTLFVVLKIIKMTQVTHSSVKKMVSQTQLY